MSSVLIKGMEMPKNCLTCKLRGDGSDSKYIWDCPFTGLEYTREEGETRRLDDCPLVEVPAPHGRLIDADKLMRDISKYHVSDGMFQHWVDVQPTIIEAERGEDE